MPVSAAASRARRTPSPCALSACCRVEKVRHQKGKCEWRMSSTVGNSGVDGLRVLCRRVESDKRVWRRAIAPPKGSEVSGERSRSERGFALILEEGAMRPLTCATSSTPGPSGHMPPVTSKRKGVFAHGKRQAHTPQRQWIHKQRIFHNVVSEQKARDRRE